MGDNIDDDVLSQALERAGFTQPDKVTGTTTTAADHLAAGCSAQAMTSPTGTS